MPHPQDRPPDNLETEDDQTVEMDLDEGMSIFIKGEASRWIGMTKVNG